MKRLLHAVGLFMAASIPVLTTLATLTTPRAEVTVSVDRKGRVVAVIQMLDPTATPPLLWAPVRANADPALLLNPAGDQHLDGRPSIRINPVTHLPEAAWARHTGINSDIAWSRFDGARWSSPLLLTSDGRSRGPTLWIDRAGNRRLAFWKRGRASDADAVLVTVLPAGETQWWVPQRVSAVGVPTRKPDIRTYKDFGSFIVAEAETPDGLSVEVFRLRQADGTPQRESDPWGRQRLYIATMSTGQLDAELVAVPGTGGQVPQIQWVEGTPGQTVLGVMFFDTQSLTWSSPSFFSLP